MKILFILLFCFQALSAQPPIAFLVDNHGKKINKTTTPAEIKTADAIIVVDNGDTLQIVQYQMITAPPKPFYYSNSSSLSLQMKRDIALMKSGDSLMFQGIFVKSNDSTFQWVNALLYKIE